MIRQYKIHTDLDGMNDKVWDVTNGKVRLYQPSDLGIEVSNNLWGSDGIGVMGERSISQPDIKFTLITLGASVKENYKLINEFVNDILSVKYVTLEYQTELFQVFADVALSKVTKTEGYGFNGTFEEEITFNMITKWYTYERLEFSTIENGEIIEGVSKIYGGKKGDENVIKGTEVPFSVTGGGASNVLNSMYTFKGATLGESGIKEGDVLTAFYQWETSGSNISGAFRPRFNRTLFTILGDGVINISDANTFGTSVSKITVTADMLSVTGIQLRQDNIPSSVEIKIYNLYLGLGTPSVKSGYRYIEDKAYTYYGETDVQRLSRWKIDEPFFSFTAKLTPSATIDATKQIGLKFLNENLNEYSAILFTIDQRPDYIMINTDVNDEFYLATTGATTINAFPTLDMQRYRTRIFTKGQMTMQNLSSVEIKVKRKVDFI